MNTPPVLRLHHLETASRSNGPGWRSVIWLQGCTLGCSGCFNPETHSRNSGFSVTASSLAQTIFAERSKIEGITISGGEPLQQLRSLLPFLAQIRSQTHLSVLLFSGYSWPEIERMPLSDQLIPLLDVLIAGRYIASLRSAHGLIGSTNKTIHFFSTRYTHADLESVPETEVILSRNGEITLSGIDPIRWTGS